jgi:hypothetical protein
MTIKESNRVHLTLVQVLHAIPRRASMGGPTLSHYTFVKHGGVSSNSVTIEATKFAGPHKSRKLLAIFCRLLLADEKTSRILNFRQPH